MDIKELISQLESQELDFKVKADESLGKALCAFTNTNGGIIILGVSKNKVVKGTSQREEEKVTSIAETCKPGIKFNSEWKEIERKNILIIKVPKSNKIHTYKGIAYKRVGSSSMPMDVKEIIELSRERGMIKFDEEFCDATLEDIDEEKVRWFLRKARAERNFDVDPETPVKEVLQRLKLIKNEKITNSAVLLFCKDPQKFFLQAEVRCAKFKGTEPVKPFIDMRVIGGTVFEQIDSAEKFVLNNIHKYAWIEPGKIERQEKWEYPPDAVREAITNAVCHRDYYSTSNVQVRIFDDRIEVWNSGKLPEGWTVETLKQKHESKPKNPLIAKCFFLVKYIEQWGTGTNDMINLCLKEGLPEPEFEDTGTSIIVTIRKSKLTPELLENLGLNERQKNAIEYVKKKGSITNKEYQKINNVSKQTATRDLVSLFKKNIFLKYGVTGKGTYYVLAERAHKGLIKGSKFLE